MPEARLVDLDDRVRSLEMKANVAIWVAVIFGLGGAGIGGLLSSAEGRVSRLEARVSSEQTTIEAMEQKAEIDLTNAKINAIGTIKANAYTVMKAAASDELAKFWQKSDQLSADIGKIRAFIPFSYSAYACKVGRQIGELFMLHDSNTSLPYSMPFELTGNNVVGLSRHEWATVHVCEWKG